MLDIQYLMGEKIQYIGRACSLSWLGFGEIKEVHDRNGNPRTVATYALHFICPWRIRSLVDSHIVMASADMFLPVSGMEETDDFDWDIQGGNLYDEKIAQLLPSFTNVRVTAVSLSPTYDLCVTLSNQMAIECFINNSTTEECWRFFKPYMGGPEFVITGCGVEE